MRKVALATAIALTLTLIGPPATADERIHNACPPGQVPPSGFVDTHGNTHEEAINCIVWHDITRGIDAQHYGPDRAVRRDQMASFMARTLDALDVPIPAPADQGFTDVAGNPHADRINQLAAAGIVAGTTPSTYSPALDVRRDQMATFLVRTFEYAAHQLTASQDYFTDTTTTPHRDNINKAAEAGFTGGTAPGIYSPFLTVQRDQMASFIARMMSAAQPDQPDDPPIEEPPEEEPPGEEPAFSDGTHVVGTDIQPGRYRALNVDGCYWERLDGFSGELDDIKANDIVTGASVVVDILGEDEGFRSNRCGNWYPVTDTPAAPDPNVINNGVWVVGLDIEPGLYRSDPPPDTHCYWARLSWFSGDFDELIANGLDEDPTIVEIQPGDVGFKASRCGTWTQV